MARIAYQIVIESRAKVPPMVRLKLSWLLVIALTAVAVHAQQKAPATKAAAKPAIKETPHLAFVSEYIRELSAYQEIREKGEQENAEAQKSSNSSDIFMSLIHNSTLFQLELQTDIAQLKSMRLNDPFNFLIPSITNFYGQKIKLWQRMSDLGTAFIGGPQPGVDYAQLGAEMPKIRADLDYIDQALFEAVPGIFATLIDAKADSQGHTSHLIITKAERQDLIEKLDTDFGSKLDEKNQNYGVTAASVLKAYLLKDFKSADEPWE
jgi:hypothetical protein